MQVWATDLMIKNVPDPVPGEARQSDPARQVQAQQLHVPDQGWHCPPAQVYHQQVRACPAPSLPLSSPDSAQGSLMGSWHSLEQRRKGCTGMAGTTPPFFFLQGGDQTVQSLADLLHGSQVQWRGLCARLLAGAPAGCAAHDGHRHSRAG